MVVEFCGGLVGHHHACNSNLKSDREYLSVNRMTYFLLWVPTSCPHQGRFLVGVQLGVQWVCEWMCTVRVDVESVSWMCVCPSPRYGELRAVPATRHEIQEIYGRRVDHHSHLCFSSWVAAGEPQQTSTASRLLTKHITYLLAEDRGYQAIEQQQQQRNRQS
jgi:hypothetical protein